MESESSAQPNRFHETEILPELFRAFAPRLLVLAVACLCVRWVGARTTSGLVGVGLVWVVLTVLFEVGLGKLVLGLPWERVTQDYDPTRGGFLAFGLLFMLASPLLASRIRGPMSDER